MKTFSKNQEVVIKTGTYAGEKAWFQQHSKRPGGEHCFVQLKRANYKGAQLKISDIEAV